MQAYRTDSKVCRMSVSEINRAAAEDPLRFVLRGERSYRRDIENTACRIASEHRCRLVMLAGPSSSGKTTTARLLAEALRRAGTGSVDISLDNFFRGGNAAPLLPDGSRDYEALEAMDIEDVRRCLRGLVEDGRCRMPVYDFKRHVPEPFRREVRLKKNEVAIVEGIHALDPALTEGLPDFEAHRVYVSVGHSVTDRGKILFSPVDIRFLRRMVRDHQFRRTPPEQTLSMWDNVMAGEYKYIQPFRAEADTELDSFHAYELCVLRDPSLTLLHTVPARTPRRAYAERLEEGLGRVHSMDCRLVPGDSIIREFIGGG